MTRGSSHSSSPFILEYFAFSRPCVGAMWPVFIVKCEFGGESKHWHKYGDKVCQKKRQVSHTNRRLVPSDIVTIIMENSGIYKKHCVQMVYNGDGLGSVLCVCVCVLSQSHTSKDHKSRIKALGHHVKCLLAAGGCGIVVSIATLFECQPH